MSNRRILIFTDADNTLWDTDRVYANAQLKLLKAVEGTIGIRGPATNQLQFVREYDQEIAAKHHKGLRYPPALLAQAIALGLQGIDPRTAARIACLGGSPKHKLGTNGTERIGQRLIERLRVRPQLRRGVRRGLRGLAIRGYTTIVVTEGSKTKCRDLLRHYELESFVERVIESPKHPDLYRRVCRLGGGADHTVMIGDQLDRDILPAKAAGLVTVYFPGGFKPRWSPVAGGHHPADYQIASFAEAVDIVAALERKESLVSKAV